VDRSIDSPFFPFPHPHPKPPTPPIQLPDQAQARQGAGSRPARLRPRVNITSSSSSSSSSQGVVCGDGGGAGRGRGRGAGAPGRDGASEIGARRGQGLPPSWLYRFDLAAGARDEQGAHAGQLPGLSGRGRGALAPRPRCAGLRRGRGPLGGAAAALCGVRPPPSPPGGRGGGGGARRFGGWVRMRVYVFSGYTQIHTPHHPPSYDQPGSSCRRRGRLWPRGWGWP
jgi:hypothetical protein